MSNKRISGFSGIGKPKSLIKNSLNVRPGVEDNSKSSNEHAPQINESKNYKTSSKTKLDDDVTSGGLPTNSDSKRGPGRPETNSQPLNAGAVQFDKEMAWELIEGEIIPHSDCYLTSLGIPLDSDARENYCMLASIHGYFGKKLYDSQEDLFNKNLYILKENKRRNIFKSILNFELKLF
jgi:hypothetical protein